MTAAAASSDRFPPVHRQGEPRKSLVHRAALRLVWITLAASGIVFTEPAPVDVAMMGLIVLLPTVGLVSIRPLLVGFLALWLLCAACAYLAAATATDAGTATIHTTVSLYLYVATFVLAAFVARRPAASTELLLNGYLWAGLLAALAALAGYFDLVPGTGELFTKYGRAAGTFKDPNVLGSFLVPPLLYALHIALTRSSRASVPALAAAGLLGLAILLSFSRGAWFNLAAALVVYGYLAFITAARLRQRLRILLLLAGGAVVISGIALAATQLDAVSRLLDERASLTQSYDVGPDGRFGGQEKAIDVILEKPLGIGALEFAPAYHPEAAHNVYLTMVLNAGWLGGGIYWVVVAVTLMLGFRRLLVAAPTRPLLLLAYAAFLANVLEGVIIDTDHWRHFYLLMAIIWGLLAAPPAAILMSRRPARRLHPRTRLGATSIAAAHRWVSGKPRSARVCRAFSAA